jgi:hypothetical protein
MMFPGEQEAIDTVTRLGAEYGYGNLISHLRAAWAKTLRERYGMTHEQADRGALVICPYCSTDHRTGQKLG